MKTSQGQLCFWNQNWKFEPRIGKRRIHGRRQRWWCFLKCTHSFARSLTPLLIHPLCHSLSVTRLSFCTTTLQSGPKIFGEKLAIIVILKKHFLASNVIMFGTKIIILCPSFFDSKHPVKKDGSIDRYVPPISVILIPVLQGRQIEKCNVRKGFSFFWRQVTPF